MCGFLVYKEWFDKVSVEEVPLGVTSGEVVVGAGEESALVFF